MLTSIFSVFILATRAFGRPSSYDARPFAKVVKARQDYNRSNTDGLNVDLGYAIYQGTVNASTNLNVWRGIRFAAPPTDKLRWQAPQAPPIDRAAAIPATGFGPTCPGGPNTQYSIQAVDNSLANEDCLFLNVYSPSNATGPLPVLVWIHGGGYGRGNGREDMSHIINTNQNSFVAVSIQYRLAAFGFLSSDELYRRGVPNAGIHDQLFALQWIQQYIHLFNGDPTQVTISGQSAGGGAVMLLALAHGGTLGTSLFQNVIAASPYLPTQYSYADWIPSQSYYALATAVGCGPSLPYGANNTESIFSCLQNTDTKTLINSTARIVQSSTFGTWAFLPVIDGTLLPSRPTSQLLQKKVNGHNILTGNVANEGPAFVPQNIRTTDDVISWLQHVFPLLTNNDIAKILLYYPSDSNDTIADPYNTTLAHATTGDSGPVAINVSNIAVGPQQRMNNIYAETTFVCPSYWLAEAFSDSGFDQEGKAYRYTYSVLPSTHGADVGAYFREPGSSPWSVSYQRAIQTIWGNFVVNSNPSISQELATGQTNSTDPNIYAGAEGLSDDSVTNWPEYSIYNPFQIDLNQTGGTQTSIVYSQINVTSPTGEGAVNVFRRANALTWEGGRGMRCDFWRSVGEIVPE